MKSVESGDPPEGPQPSDDARVPHDAPPPAVGWASGPLGAVQRAQREIARQTALQARAVADFAATRPASVDRQPGEKGCMSEERRAARPEVLAGVSEWAAQELAIALSIPTPTAEALLTRSLTLVHRVPESLAALETGVLHTGHLWGLLEKVALISDARIRERLEKDLLAWVARRSVTTPAQWDAKIRRELLARNVRSAAHELENALRRRGVRLRPDRTEGMAVLEALLTVPEAEALLDALRQYADALDDTGSDGPPRSRAQKMADCLMDLVLRPGETDLATVQARFTLVAPVPTMLGGDQPAEVADTPVPAEMARALAQGLGLLPTPPANAAPADDPMDAPVDVCETGQTGAAGVAADEAWWAEVEAQVLGDPGDEMPADELQRQLEETAASLMSDPEFAAWFDDSGPVPLSREAGLRGVDADTSLAADPVTGEVAVSDTEASWWAAADAAVAEAGAAQLALHRAVSRARRAVNAAELADRADQDAWDQSRPAPISAAPTELADRADQEAWDQSRPAPISAAPTARAALASATAEQRAALAALLERTGGGGLADRPRIAVTDALTGALRALTDARELRDHGTCGRVECRTGRTVCDHDLTDRPGLGPPEACASYRPGVRLDRFLRARDRRCRFPGCRRRVPAGGELDHDVPWPDGPTSAGNLNGFCTSHHRGKHQAPGWQYDLSPEGTLTVTTPTGLTASTDPPPY